MKLLNPFAFYLERKERRFYEVGTKPVYQNGEYKTYNFSSGTHKWFITCRGNIIVTETTGIPKDLIDALVEGKRPTDYSRFHYDRMLREYDYGLKCAEAVGFEVTK